MKKILAIAVACIYLAITSGLVLQVHYCMGERMGASVKFAEAETRTCGNCGMQNGKNKCCHDDVKLLKLQDAHKQVNADFNINPPVAATQDFDLINPSACISNQNAEEVNINSPPEEEETGQPSIFIFHCLLRI
ncbi:MAG: hypothetical protein QM726_18085 [Chitinophagaceae bacterium]